jgi:hypothetical protein
LKKSRLFVILGHKKKATNFTSPQSPQTHRPLFDSPRTHLPFDGLFGAFQNGELNGASHDATRQAPTKTCGLQFDGCFNVDMLIYVDLR